MDTITQNLMLIVSNQLLTTLVAMVVATLLAVRAIRRKRDQSAPGKDGIPLPPGPPPRRFWDHIMPTTK